MTEHRVRFVHKGMRVSIWAPGSEAGIHDHVEDVEPDYPEEWEFVYAECSCGKRFEDDAAAWQHLDAVAAGRTESESKPVPKSVSPGEATLEELPAYPVVVDVFTVNAWIAEDNPVSGWKGLDTPLAEEAWTGRKLLKTVRRKMPESIWTYDTVCYRAEPEDVADFGDESGAWLLAAGERVIEVPSEAVVAEVVPEGQPVRVTNRDLAPYEFRGSP